MNFLTHKEFLDYCEAHPGYWKGAEYRWDYMSVAISMLRQIGAKTIAEAGTNGVKLCPKSYEIKYPEIDLNRTPYHMRTDDGGIFISDNYFDAFVALQVWEHLDKQREAFDECCRIAKNVILSFPYKWERGDNRHIGIDHDKIMSWVGNKEPVSRVLVNNRIIYRWECQ